LGVVTALARPDTAPSLEDLVATVNREHALVGQSARAVLDHAMAAGDALLAIKERHIGHGEWRTWVEANVDVHWTTANDYMRVAYFRERLEELGATQLKEALTLLLGLRRGDSPPGRAGLPGLADEARELRANGLSDSIIAERLGVSNSAVYKWTRPERVRQYAEKARREKEQLRELREREQQVKVARAVRKKGGAIADLYALSERMQDVLGEAHRECEDQEARRELALAGQCYRQMRDHVVRALGVSS
jgi:predicted transcriptional regulator